MGEALFSATINSESGGWGNYTVRHLLPAVYCTKNASRIKVKFVATVNNINLTKVYFGHKADSGDAYDFDGSQVQLLFSSGAALDLTAGNEVYSDEIDFSLDATKPIVISVHVKGTDGSGYISYDSTFIGPSYYKSGDDASTTNASSYTVWATNGVPLIGEIYGVTVGDADSYGTQIYSSTNKITNTEYQIAGYTTRSIIPSSLISASGSKIRVLFSASVGPNLFFYGWYPNIIYIGHKASSGDVYDFDGNQVELKFGGNSGFQLAMGNQIWSDEATIDIDETKDLIIAIYQDTSDTDNDVIPLFPSTGCTGYYKSGSDASTTNASTYTGPYSLYGDKSLGVYAIEIIADAPSDLSIFASECYNINNINIYASEVVGSDGNLA